METGVAAPGGGEGGLRSRRLPSSSHSSSASGLAPSLAAASAAAAAGTGKAGSGRSKTNDGAVPASVDNYLPAGARPSYDENPTRPLAPIPAQSPAQFPGGEGSGGVAFTSPSNSRESGDGERRGKRKWYEHNAAASPPPGYPAPTTTQPLKYAPTASNRGPLSPRNTRDNNARTPAPNGVPKSPARRNRPRPGSASSSVASSAAASPTSTPPSTKVGRQPGNPPHVVSKWICTPQSTIDLANSPWFRGNPDREIQQALEEFDYLENRVDPTDASQILRDYERIAVNGFADVVGDDTANRGQRPSGNQNCIMTGFGTHLCKLFRGGGRANKINPDQKSIRLLITWLLYGILKDGRTEGVTTDIAREFAAKNVTIFDCFLRCCDSDPARGCPDGNKYKVFEEQLIERSRRKGLSGDAVMGLYKLEAAINIGWHAVHLHALKKGPLNLLSACLRNAKFVWNNPHCKPLSSPYINVFFVPHPENYPGRLVCPLKFPLATIDRFSEHTCGWAQGLKGLPLTDCSVTLARVPTTTDETKVIRRMAKYDKQTPEERAAVAEASRKDCSKGGTEQKAHYALADALVAGQLTPRMKGEFERIHAKPQYKNMSVADFIEAITKLRRPGRPLKETKEKEERKVEEKEERVILPEVHSRTGMAHLGAELERVLQSNAELETVKASVRSLFATNSNGRKLSANEQHARLRDLLVRQQISEANFARVESILPEFVSIAALREKAKTEALLPEEQAILAAAKRVNARNAKQRAKERAESQKVSFSKTVSELVSAANIQRVSDLPDFYGMGEIMAKSGYDHLQSNDELLQRSIIGEVIKQKDLVRDAQWGPALSTGSSNVAIARSNATASSESGNVEVATISAGDEKETTAAAASEPVCAEPWACQCGGELVGLFPETGTKAARGISYHQSGKWQAQIGYAGKSRYLGLFDSQDAALRGYEAAWQSLRNTSVCGRTSDEEREAVVKRNIGLAKEAARCAACGSLEKPFAGKEVVISGLFPEVDPRAGHAHAQLKTKIISLGGKVRGRPTKKTKCNEEK